MSKYNSYGGAENSGTRNTGNYQYTPPGYGESKNQKNDRRSESNDRRKNYDSYTAKSPKNYDNESKDDQYGDSKFRSGDRVPDKLDPELREVFPFRVFIKDEYLKEGLASKNEIEEIIRSTQIDDISMDNTIQVPDMPG